MRLAWEGRSGKAVGRVDAEVEKHPVIAFSAVAIVSGVLILLVGQGLGFYNDDWGFLRDRSLSNPASWWPANNEHWVTVAAIAYTAIVAAFGTASYLPFQVAVLVTHVLAAGGLYVLARRVASPRAALAATTLFLFLGSGYYNLFWGFQIGMVGALAFGLWALVLLPRWSVAAAALLVLGVATSGNALFVAAGAIVYAAFVRRRALALFMLPLIAYGTWWLMIGAQTARVRPPLTDDRLGERIAFPFQLAAAAVGDLAGIAPLGGTVLLILLAVPVALRFQGRLDPLVLASGAVLMAQLAALTLSRGARENPTSAHYVYIAAPFLLLGVLALAPPRRLAVPAFVWALAANAVLLVYYGQTWAGVRVDSVLRG